MAVVTYGQQQIFSALGTPHALLHFNRVYKCTAAHWLNYAAGTDYGYAALNAHSGIISFKGYLLAVGNGYRYLYPAVIVVFFAYLRDRRRYHLARNAVYGGISHRLIKSCLCDPSDALAAVNIVAPLWLFSTGIGLMFGVGASVVASIHLSHNKPKTARINITQSIVVSSLLLMCTSTLFCLFAPQVVHLLGSSERLKPLAVEYMCWFVPFSAFTALLNSGMFFLRLDGSPNFAMFCNIVASVLNIILDYLFIFPFGWGMFGAAFASAIGTTVGALMIIIYLSRRNCALRFYPVKFSRNSMKLMKRNVGYMCRLGSSAFLCEVAIACMMFVGNLVFIHYLKEDGVAAFSIACYFFPIIFMVYNAIAQSAQPIISFNYGLNETLRVRKTYLLALKTAVGCGICFALITIFCSREIVAMFIDRSYPAYDIAVKGLPLYASGFVFFAINIVSIGYFQSVERAKYATVITLLRGFILLTLCFYGLPLLLGKPGIWLATPLAELLTTLFILIIYMGRKRNGKENSISLQHGNHAKEILQEV